MYTHVTSGKQASKEASKQNALIDILGKQQPAINCSRNELRVSQEYESILKDGSTKVKSLLQTVNEYHRGLAKSTPTGVPILLLFVLNFGNLKLEDYYSIKQ
uniref:Uncharacterized protein n=1 Tax=Glossina austeni TaxID=7395 RepID=A0A1A9VYB5_GLOAU